MTQVRALTSQDRYHCADLAWRQRAPAVAEWSRVGILDSFERGLERAVNGAFARTFRSGIQPVEIASALRAEADTKAAVVSRDRILAPNEYVISLNPEDAERMLALGTTLTDELYDVLEDHANKQGYSFAGPLRIGIAPSDNVTLGTSDVTSNAVKSAAQAKQQVAWNGALEIGGQRYPLKTGRTVIGRGSDADIRISDAASSRKHAEVLWDGKRALVRDLGSTNGTKVAGQRVAEAPLTNGETFMIGTTPLTFRVVASEVRR